MGNRNIDKRREMIEKNFFIEISNNILKLSDLLYFLEILIIGLHLKAICIHGNINRNV